MRQILVIVVVVLIAGCSPRVFEKETAAFRDASIGVETAWIGLHDKVDSLKQVDRDHLRIREHWMFSVDESCAKFASVLAQPPREDLEEAARKAALEGRRELIDNCTLFQRGTGKSAPDIFVDPVDRQFLPYAKAISDYAAALAALTAAEDEAALRSAGAEVSASLSSAGDALKDLGNTDDIDINGPISALASVYVEIRLAGIERHKYNTLRDVVEGTDDAIQHMTEKLAGAEADLRKRLLNAQLNAIRKAEQDLRALTSCSPSAEWAQRQQAVIDRMLEYRAYAKTLVAGGVSYRDLGDAHTKLLNAVLSPDDFELAWLAVERLNSIGEAAKETATALGLKD